MLKKEKDFKAYIQGISKPRFLVIRNGLLGDLVFMTYMLERLRENYQNCQIDLVTSKPAAELFKIFPNINKIFCLNYNEPITEQAKLFFSLRKNKYDAVLVQEVNSHYTIMAKLVFPKYLIGFKNKLDILLDIAYDHSGHAVIAEAGTITSWTNELVDVKTKLYLTEEETFKTEIRLSRYGLSNYDKFILIQYGCSERNSIRSWSKDNTAVLADLIIDNLGMKVFFTGTSQDEEDVNYIISKMKNKAFSLAGSTSLRELMGIIKKSELVIGPDTGTLHIANALDIPVIMLMGFADKNDTGPYDYFELSKVITGTEECIPCKYKNPKPIQWEYCKDARPPLCMQQIDPNEVFTLVKETIEQKNTIFTRLIKKIFKKP